MKQIYKHANRQHKILIFKSMCFSPSNLFTLSLYSSIEQGVIYLLPLSRNIKKNRRERNKVQLLSFHSSDVSLHSEMRSGGLREVWPVGWG